jgi:hypothetical protein
MEKNELNVLWTNADPLTAEHMVLLYTINAKKREWFEEVNLIIWGATAALVIDNEKINKLVIEAMQVGVNVIGCIHCAKQLGKDVALTKMGIKLSPMGIPLTEIIKQKRNLLTI